MPTELRVEPVGADGADAFAETFVRGYGTPGFFREWLARIPARERWYCFVAFDGEAPAAAGALYPAGEVGWLGIAATLPEHRRKDGQGKPSSSYRNIIRAGFSEVYVRANYLSSPEADTSGIA